MEISDNERKIVKSVMTLMSGQMVNYLLQKRIDLYKFKLFIKAMEKYMYTFYVNVKL